MMKALCSLTMISLAAVFSTPTFTAPFSPSCEIALEKIETARKALLPFRHTMEMAQAHKDGASVETSTCTGEDRSKVNPPQPCHDSQWRIPKPDKIALAEIDQYRQERQAFEQVFRQAKRIYLLEP